MKLLKSKKFIIVLSVFLISLTTIFIGIDLTFNKPTKLNKIVAAKRYKSSGTPANTAFKDQNFYNCVVDAYNRENKTSVSYSESLTEEQLLLIKEISKSYTNSQEYCSNINDITGIEKLIGLEKLNISLSDPIEKVDLSSHNNLHYLSISATSLNDLLLPTNSVLEEIYIGPNQLLDLDLTKQFELHTLSISSSIIASIDLTQNSKLEYLSVRGKIKDIDLENNKAIKYLWLDYNLIETIDISHLTSLTSLSLYSNPLKKQKEAVYINDSIQFNSSVKLPNHMQKMISWISPSSYVEVSGNGIVTPLRAGTYDIWEKADTSTCGNFKITNSLYAIEATSVKYALNEEEGYIYTGTDTKSETILGNINLNYGEATIEDNKLLIRFEDKLIKEFNIVNISSNTYDLSKNYIYIGSDNIDPSKISVANGDLQVNNNKLQIIKNNNILQEYDLISITSDRYNLSKEYIYVGTNELDKTKINFASGELVEENNELKIKYNDSVLKTYKIVSISSRKYNLENAYILSGDNVDLSSISVINGSVVEEDNLIKIKYNNDVLDTYNKSAFKNQELYNCVVDEYKDDNNTDIKYNEHLTDDELATITSLTCNNKNIVDTNGIEKLTKLSFLRLYNNKIKEINLNNNLLLQRLELGNNEISSIDLTNNTKLSNLHLSNNELTTIDISKNPLDYLNLEYNNLDSININNKNYLRTLYLSGNNISNIDLSTNERLEFASLSYNNLIEIDVSNNLKLEDLYLSGNQIEKIDVSKNSVLNSLNLYQNNLKEINLGSSLTHLDLRKNKLTNIDTSKNLLLDYLALTENNLESIDVTKNEKLTILALGNNSLTTIDLSNNLLLTALGLENNKINTINLNNNLELNNLHINNNLLSEIDLSKNIKLEQLFISNNLLTEIDLSNNSNLNSSYVYLNDNLFNEEFFVYQGDSIAMETNEKILLPEHLNFGDFIWRSRNEQYATVDNNGLVNTKKAGIVEMYGYYDLKNNLNITNTINIIKLNSDKYLINEDKNYIVVIGEDTEDIIKTNLSVPDNIKTEIIDDKLYIKHNNDVLKTFDIVSYSLGNLRVSGKNIIVGNTVTYDDLKDNITGNITYKVYNNDEEVNEIGSLYKLYIYYGEDKIDEYIFITEYLTFNEELESKIDKDNNYILGNEIGTKVSDIKSLIDTSGSISFVDKDNKELTDDSKVGTGSKVKISLSTGDVYYELVVTGDTSGDGRLTVSDLVKINNHIISEDKKLTGVYKLASDYDGNGRITVSDIVKINNKILSN